MKKIFFTIFCIAFFYQLSAQTDVFKFKTFAAGMKCKGYKEELVEKTEIVVVINLKSNKINIYSQNESDFDLIQILQNDYDENNNLCIKWKAVDELGEKCFIDYISYKDKSKYHKASIRITKGDCITFYRLGEK